MKTNFRYAVTCQLNYIVRTLVLTLVLLLNSFWSLTTDTLAMERTVPYSLNLASPVTEAIDLSNRYIVFLHGINSASSEGEKPLDGGFSRIQEGIQEKLKVNGIKPDHFVYFSYSAINYDKLMMLVPAYCKGWGDDNCSDTLDLIDLSDSPVYVSNDTHQSIIAQAHVLDWLLSQIVKQDQAAEIDLVGFSLGGVVASYWAAEVASQSPFKNRIHSIVLINSPVGGIFPAKAMLDNRLEGKIWADKIRDFFGTTVLRELQIPVLDVDGSIVASLENVVQVFPDKVTSIQSTTDFLVNEENFTVTPLVDYLAGTVSVGRGSQHWTTEHIKYHNERLGGLERKSVAIWVLTRVLQNNHNAALRHPDTIQWVVWAIESPNQETPTIPSILDQPPAEGICGQFVMFKSGIDTLTGFRVHSSGELWYFDGYGLGPMPQEGSYGKIFEPQFFDEEFLPGIKGLWGASNITVVSSCEPTAQPVEGEIFFADFDATPLRGNAPLTVVLHNNSVGDIANCLWDYGDGTTGRLCDNYHNHTYSAAGVYTVQLRVYSTDGTRTKTRSNYITVTGPQPSQAIESSASGQTPPSPDAFVNTPSLNVRAGPGVDYAILIVAQQSDALEVIGRNTDCSWLQVITPTGIQGWVSGSTKYIKLNLPCDSIPVVSVSPAPIQPLLEQPTVVHSPTPLPPAPASTPAPPPAQPPAEIPISFTAERTTLTAGECTNLRWDVDNVRAVYLDNLGVTGHETRKVCPAATQTFRLVIVQQDKSKVEQTVTIQVTGSSSAPAAPPISFSADRTTLNPGECAILRWDVDNVNEVHLDEEGVVGHDTRKVCPDSTETYKLTVVRRDGTEEKRTVTIQVNVPAPVPGGPHGPSQPQEDNSLCGKLVKTSGGLDQWFFPSSGNPPLLKLGYSQPTTPPGLTDGAYYRVRDPQIVQSGEGCDPNFGCTTTYLLIIVDDNPYDNWEAVSSCN